jgi:hypothetical protein
MLSPILQKFELEFEHKLFLPVEQPKIDVQFNTSILVRLYINEQSDCYRNFYSMGAIMPNEIRSALLCSPVKGGNRVFIQGVMTCKMI